MPVISTWKPMTVRLISSVTRMKASSSPPTHAWGLRKLAAMGPKAIPTNVASVASAGESDECRVEVHGYAGQWLGIPTHINRGSL